MTFDQDVFEERAAIIEFSGGLSRFEAETLAAQAQGITRLEAINAAKNGNGNSQSARHHGPLAGQSRSHDLPRMQPRKEEKK